MTQLYDEGVALEQKQPAKAYRNFIRVVASQESEGIRIKAAIRTAMIASNGGQGINAQEAAPGIRQMMSVVNNRPERDSLVAELYFASGKLFDILYKSDSALILFTIARTNFSNLLGPDSEQEANCFLGIGDVYKYGLYDFEKAEQSYNRALAILERQTIVNPRKLARLYYNLATTNRSQQDYQKAVAYGLKAVANVRKLNDDQFLDRTLSVMGSIYRDLAQFDSAMAYYRQGISVNKKINAGQDNEILAGHYLGLADVFKRTAKWDESISNLSAAIRMYERIPSSDRNLYLYALRLLAEVHLGKKETRLGWPFLVRADQLRRSLRLERGGPAASVFQTFGDYSLAAGLYDSALVWYQRALVASSRAFTSMDPAENPAVDAIEMKGFAYSALLGKARSFAKDVANVKSLKSQLDCYALAEKVLLRSRMELDTEDAKWRFVDASYFLYEQSLAVIQSLHSRGGGDSLLSSAFQFMEGSKSKMLADALQEAEFLNTVDDADTLFQTLRQLKRKEIAIQDQVRKSATAAVVSQDLVQIDRDLSRVETLINEKYPAYLATQYDAKVAVLSTTQEWLRDEGAVLLEYFWGVHRVYGLLVTPDEIVLTDLGNADSLRKAIEPLLLSFVNPKNDYSKLAVHKYATSAFRVYESLLGKFDHRVKDKTRLIVIPDGLISRVPFEALVTTQTLTDDPGFNDLTYLVQSSVVSYAFSATYLTRVDDATARHPALLAFGFTGGSAERSAGITQTELAGAEAELQGLAKKFPDGLFLYGTDVTEQNFKRNASTYDLLHLAVHGEGDTATNYSATLFFRDQGTTEDGRLRWYELFDMKLRASLAVLSSCESGIGKAYRGEGMLSMASAFAFAGCRNIVMGLWKVDDQVSAVLMDEFYAGLLEGKKIDEALTLAKRQYLKSADNVSANPRLWGSLVAYGDDQVVARRQRIWLYGAATAFLAAVISILFRRRKTGNP